jgi:hypothetical protein
MQSPSETALAPLDTVRLAPLRQQGAELVERAKAVKITDAASYEAVAGDLRRVVNYRRMIEKLFEKPKKHAFQAHRSITQLEAEFLALGTSAERIYKVEIGRWEDEERRRREQEQARISEDLRRREEDDRLRQAEALSDAGHQEEAEALLEQPIIAPVVEIQHEKPAGISTRGKWSFRILDEAKIDRRFLTPDLTKIRQTVTALGPDAVEVVGGIEVLRDTIVAVR